jgi:hypothetical protein
MKTIINISFKNLRQNYREVYQLLCKESVEKKINTKSKIANDLFLFGDDNYYLLHDFVIKNNLDFTNFDYDKHFETECELNITTWSILSIIFIPLFIVKYILSFLINFLSKDFGNKIHRFNFFLKDYQSNRIDLTLGDLITSKICGKFQLRENFQFVLLKSEIKNQQS